MANARVSAVVACFAGMLIVDSYKNTNTLAGIIYLYDISRKRMHGSSFKNFTMFRVLCGPDASINVILATTMWSEVKDSVGRSREKQLAEAYWKPLLDEGSRINRFECTYDSAWDIIASLLEKVPLEVIQIQKELVLMNKILPETDAAKTLRNELNKFLEEQKVIAQKMLRERTPEAKARYDETATRLASILAQMQQLKVPWSRKIMKVLFAFKARPTHGIQRGFTLVLFALFTAHSLRLTQEARSKVANQG
jgi:hypothetical protein